MRRVDPLDMDSVELFLAVVDSKLEPRSRRLRNITKHIFDAYRCYEDCAPILVELVPISLSQTQTADLHHCYEVPTKPLISFRARLLNDQLYARCCFCNVGESSNLDHYLPKQAFPEFSIFSLNLVACCAVCNSYKKDHIEKDGVRACLHPYFDNVPTSRFLTVDTGLSSDCLSLRFSVFQPAGMDSDTYALLDSHFNLLKLADRYLRMSLEHLGSLSKSLERIYGNLRNAGGVAQELINTAIDLEEHYGVNYWRAVLYRSLSDLVEFCDGGFRCTSVDN